MLDDFKQQLPDADPHETQEWIEALDDVVQRQGPRARRLPAAQGAQARPHAARRPARAGADALHQHHLARAGAALPRRRGDGEAHPPHHPLERRGHGDCAPTTTSPGIGGHLSTYASSASLYEVGFNHFFRGKDDGRPATRSSSRATPRPASTRAPSSRAGSPRRSSTTSAARSCAARACRRYPHPRLMPDFWEFPTVSMGLGPDQRHLPGALQPLPAGPRPRRHRELARVGVPRRRRDRRARGARRAARWRRARGSTT